MYAGGAPVLPDDMDGDDVAVINPPPDVLVFTVDNPRFPRFPGFKDGELPLFTSYNAWEAENPHSYNPDKPKGKGGKLQFTRRQFPVLPAAALTVHACQGLGPAPLFSSSLPLTFLSLSSQPTNAVWSGFDVMDADMTNCGTYGSAYTLLTRTKSIEGLNLVAPVILEILQRRPSAELQLDWARMATLEHRTKDKYQAMFPELRGITDSCLGTPPSQRHCKITKQLHQLGFRMLPERLVRKRHSAAECIAWWEWCCEGGRAGAAWLQARHERGQAVLNRVLAFMRRNQTLRVAGKTLAEWAGIRNDDEAAWRMHLDDLKYGTRSTSRSGADFLAAAAQECRVFLRCFRADGSIQEFAPRDDPIGLFHVVESTVDSNVFFATGTVFEEQFLALARRAVERRAEQGKKQKKTKKKKKASSRKKPATSATGSSSSSSFSTTSGQPAARKHLHQEGRSLPTAADSSSSLRQATAADSASCFSASSSSASSSPSSSASASAKTSALAAAPPGEVEITLRLQQTQPELPVQVARALAATSVRHLRLPSAMFAQLGVPATVEAEVSWEEIDAATRLALGGISLSLAFAVMAALFRHCRLSEQQVRCVYDCRPLLRKLLSATLLERLEDALFNHATADNLATQHAMLQDIAVLTERLSEAGWINVTDNDPYAVRSQGDCYTDSVALLVHAHRRGINPLLFSRQEEWLVNRNKWSQEVRTKIAKWLEQYGETTPVPWLPGTPTFEQSDLRGHETWLQWCARMAKPGTFVEAPMVYATPFALPCQVDLVTSAGDLVHPQHLTASHFEPTSFLIRLAHRAYGDGHYMPCA